MGVRIAGESREDECRPADLELGRTAMRLHERGLDKQEDGERARVADLRPGDLRMPHARLSRALVSRVEIPASDLKAAALDESHWEECDLSMANLSSCDFSRSVWFKVKLSDA